MRKVRIPGQLKSIAIRLIIYTLTVLFGVALNYVPHTWIVTFAVLTLVIAVSFIFTEVKHKWIYMALIIVFSIVFSHYYLEPRNEVFKKRYDRIVKDFVNIKNININKIQILYKTEGNSHYEYHFKILNKKIISEFQDILSRSYEMDTDEFTGHYKQLYLITAYGDNDFVYSFFYKKELLDVEEPRWIKNGNGSYFDNSKYLDIGQLELLYRPYQVTNSVYGKGKYVALYRCQELILFLNKHVKRKADEEPYRLYRVIE